MRRRGRESQREEGDLTRLSSDGRTMDLLTSGMHDVGQSDPVPPTPKCKLYIGYFIRASLSTSRTSFGCGSAADILNKTGRMHQPIVNYQ